MIKWCIATVGEEQRLTQRPRYLWNKADWNALNCNIAAYEWKTRFATLSTVDECYNDFIDYYTIACNTHIPKTTKPVKRSSSPWLIDGLLQLIEDKRCLFGLLRAAGKSSKSEISEAYKTACKKVTRGIKDAIEKFELEMVKRTRVNARELHSFVRHQQTVPDRIHALKDSSGTLRTNGSDICRILNESFQKVFTIRRPIRELPWFPDRTNKRLDP